MTEIPNALTPSGQVVDEVVDYVVDAITIGTVTASEPGEAPSLTLTKTVGGNYVLDAVIPRGDPAPPGLPGESAYQIWVDQGNIGTEEDFLADLVGPTGTIEDVMAANIGDATAAGRALLTAADAAAQKLLLALAAVDITDTTPAGRALMTATDAAAQKIALAMVKGDVGLGAVANLAPADLPVSTATQTELNLKAPLASPALTGTPTAPTATAGVNTTQLATTAFVTTAVSAIPVQPIVYPITLTSPTAGATGVGTGGTYTFVGTAFYSDYGVTQTERKVNVYNAAGTALVTTYTTAGAGTTVAVTLTGGPLTVNTAYQAEMVYTDALGNTAVSPKVSFTTATVFKPLVGQSYQGGFLAFENFGDGDLYDLIVAAKSTEASKTWASDSTLLNINSRMNGPANTAAFAANGLTSTTLAGPYAKSIFIGGIVGYLGAIDELRAISSKLKPSAATQAAFQAGGAEVYTATSAWASTEFSASLVYIVDMTVGADGAANTKTTSYPVRPIRRITVTPPYPIGTAMEGGYLAAYFTDMSVAAPNTFMLIVADKATEVSRAWDSASLGARTTVSRTNGASNTTALAIASASGFPAANYCDTLTSGTKTDWYLGAIDEMLAIARMNASLPSGQQIAYAVWTSTEIDGSNAKAINATPAETSGAKATSLLVRPIRRVLLP